jgi:hypothetical protein
LLKLPAVVSAALSYAVVLALQAPTADHLAKPEPVWLQLLKDLKKSTDRAVAQQAAAALAE